MKFCHTPKNRAGFLWKTIPCMMAGLLLFSACDASDTDDIAKTTVSPSPAATAAGAATQEPQPTKNTEKSTPSNLAFQKGQPFPKDLEGTELIFSADFDNTGFDCDGEASGWFKGVDSRVVDGILKINIDDSGQRLPNMDTWIPNPDYYFDDYAQLELSCDLASFLTDTTAAKANHVGSLWGCYVKDYLFSNASNANDGLWFGFCGSQNRLALYGLSLSKWGTPFTTVSLPETLDEMKHIVIVCTDDCIAYVYMTLSTGEEKLVCKVVMEPESVTVYDMDGNASYSEKYMSDFDGSTLLDGAHFVLFSHQAATDVDNVTIKGFPK